MEQMERIKDVSKDFVKMAKQRSEHDILRYHGGVKADIRFQDGALPHAIGAKNYQVMRATRVVKHGSDGSGWTYNHAPMLTWWRGHLYVAYLSNPLSEHTAPCQVMINRSQNGETWGRMKELFPPLTISTKPYQGPKKELLAPTGKIVMGYSMLFFTSSTGRLLTTSFYGLSPDDHTVPRGEWGPGRVVREVYEDFSFSPIYFLHYNEQGGYTKENTTVHPYFQDSADTGFIEACQELLEDPYASKGTWGEKEKKQEDLFALTYLRAPSFYTLEDGRTVMVAKDSLVSISEDDGKTWEKVERDSTIDTGAGKVWGQRTADGAYALVYNPSSDSAHRWPLAVITGDNGKDFDNLLAITPEISPCRYTGFLKNLGAQYVRGVSEQNTQPSDGKLWICYSMNKEDIWVASIPVPISGREETNLEDRLDSPSFTADRWNFFSPRWCPVTHSPEQGGILLEDADLYDRAIASRNFPACAQGEITARIKVNSQHSESALLLSLQDREGRTPLEISFGHEHVISIMNGGRWHQYKTYQPETWYDVSVRFDTYQSKAIFKVTQEEEVLLETPVLYSQSVHSLERIRFASKIALPWQTLQDTGRTMALGDLPGGHEPIARSHYAIAAVKVTAKE